MIITNRKKYGIPYRYIWFAKRPSLSDAVIPSVYMNCMSDHATLGFVRKRQHTNLIDLTVSPQTLFESFGKNTRYKIRRAEREGIVTEELTSLDEYVKFYNEFAKTKERNNIQSGQLKGWGQYIRVFCAKADSSVVVMHSYVIDKEVSRVRLLHSASLFRNSDSSHERNAVGRANRLLHFRDMIFFREQGIQQYDFGGYAKNTQNVDLSHINRFKDEFGGKTVEETMFQSIPIFLIKLFSKK